MDEETDLGPVRRADLGVAIKVLREQGLDYLARAALIGDDSKGRQFFLEGQALARVVRALREEELGMLTRESSRA